MKNIIYLIICTIILAGCEIEDDGPGTVQVYAEVVDADLPESFERGKTYEIDITYLLPDACHSPLGLYATRGANEGPGRRDIYVAGIATTPATDAECTLPDENLEKESFFSIRIDEDQPFTFYLWKGIDEDNKSIYNEIIVPVTEPASPTATE